MEDHTVSLIELDTHTHNEVNDDSILSSKTISKQSSVVIPNSNKKDQKFWENTSIAENHNGKSKRSCETTNLQQRKKASRILPYLINE